MSTYPDLTGVIFDMDGVLIDSEKLHYQSTIMYLNDELGLSYDEGENAEFLGRSDLYMFQKLIARYRLSLAPREMIERRRDIYLKLLTGNVTLMTGAKDFIAVLKARGYKLGLASSSLRTIIELVITEGGIKESFHAIQSGENVRHGKPHPEIFMLTAQEMDVRPELCAVIEDTTVGIQAAKAAGMYAVGFAAPGAPEQDFGEADVVVSSFADLRRKAVLPVG